LNKAERKKGNNKILQSGKKHQLHMLHTVQVQSRGFWGWEMGGTRVPTRPRGWVCLRTLCVQLRGDHDDISWYICPVSLSMYRGFLFAQRVDLVRNCRTGNCAGQVSRCFPENLWLHWTWLTKRVGVLFIQSREEGK